jgi:hypothetical protein
MVLVVQQPVVRPEGSCYLSVEMNISRHAPLLLQISCR